jgi:hypothetical protein
MVRPINAVIIVALIGVVASFCGYFFSVTRSDKILEILKRNGIIAEYEEVPSNFLFFKYSTCQIRRLSFIDPNGTEPIARYNRDYCVKLISRLSDVVQIDVKAHLLCKNFDLLKASPADAYVIIYGADFDERCLERLKSERPDLSLKLVGENTQVYVAE